MARGGDRVNACPQYWPPLPCSWHPSLEVILLLHDREPAPHSPCFSQHPDAVRPRSAPPAFRCRMARGFHQRPLSPLPPRGRDGVHPLTVVVNPSSVAIWHWLLHQKRTLTAFPRQTYELSPPKGGIFGVVDKMGCNPNCRQRH